MKKFLCLASCFAAVLMLSNVSFAQEAVGSVAPCPCALAPSSCSVTPMVTLPINHPGLSVNPREVRRMMRLDARFSARQARLDYRHATPTFPSYPWAGVVTEGEPGAVAAVPGAPGGSLYAGPVVQTGRFNASLQRTGGAPVINFLSVVRGAPRYFDVPGYYPVQAPPQP